MREIFITEQCLDFIDSQNERVSRKFYHLIEVMSGVKIIHTLFVKKILNSNFYELRIKAGNEYRIVMFTVDHLNFNEATKIICIHGFIKKSTKDYNKALKKAEFILNNYLDKKSDD